MYGMGLDNRSKMWLVRLTAPFMLVQPTLNSDESLDAVYPWDMVHFAQSPMMTKYLHQLLRRTEHWKGFSGEVTARRMAFPEILVLRHNIFEKGVLLCQPGEAPVYVAIDPTKIDDDDLFSNAWKLDLARGKWKPLKEIPQMERLRAVVRTQGVMGETTRSIQIEEEGRKEWFENIMAHVEAGIPIDPSIGMRRAA
jgi:hypothetical protein